MNCPDCGEMMGRDPKITERKQTYSVVVLVSCPECEKLLDTNVVTKPGIGW